VSYVVDTNVLSEFRKIGDGRADLNVMAWAATVDASDLYLSAITLMEIELGILRLERRDPAQGARLRVWFNERVLPEFADRILPVDEAVALCAARLHVPDPRSDRDAYVAATAMVHGMAVVTRNVGDFSAAPVTVLNPWISVP
jgi:predicted nucleic acid-binding protein